MSAYFFSIGATAAVFVLLALSLNIITGYAGQAMMGQAAFFGIGAYTCIAADGMDVAGFDAAASLAAAIDRAKALARTF